jgi:hypothetical protein
VLALATLVAVAGCGGSGGTAGGSSGGSGFSAALGKVADTPGAREQVTYDDTAALVRLAGSSGSQKGFGVLLGLGATSIAQLMSVIAGDTGIDPYKASYEITAGLPPTALTLISGGQDSAAVTSHMTKLGWKQSGGSLVLPAENLSSPNEDLVQYELAMPLLSASGSNVAIGNSTHADISQIGSPSGATLTSDPLISSLASCLGNVVAASIDAYPADLGHGGLTGYALGVTQPASNTATPHVVVCAAWSTHGEAGQYAAAVSKALSSGISAQKQSYASLLPGSSVTTVGGARNVVQWKASTPGRADEIFALWESNSLPALPG